VENVRGRHVERIISIFVVPVIALFDYVGRVGGGGVTGQENARESPHDFADLVLINLGSMGEFANAKSLGILMDHVEQLEGEGQVRPLTRRGKGNVRELGDYTPVHLREPILR
jgi:hypothetical protein